MIRDGFIPQPVKSPGTAALFCLAVTWHWVVLEPAFGQESVTTPAVPAPLPKNLTPYPSNDPVVVSQPLRVAQPLPHPSCEPVFNDSCGADDCTFCLEVWKGYCQEKRRCGHVYSPRHLLSNCCSWWWRLRSCCWDRRGGLFIGLPRFADPVDDCGADGRHHTLGCHGRADCCETSQSKNSPSPAEPTPSTEPPKPSQPESPPSTPRNELPPTSPDSSSTTSTDLPGESLPPEPGRVRAKSASLQGEQGTLRLIRHLQQATPD